MSDDSREVDELVKEFGPQQSVDVVREMIIEHLVRDHGIDRDKAQEISLAREILIVEKVYWTAIMDSDPNGTPNDKS